MFGSHARSIGHEVLQVLALILAHFAEGIFPMLSLAELLLVVGLSLLDFIPELIVQELIQEYLHNDFIFRAVTRQAIGSAGGTKCINQRLSLFGYLFGIHYMF